MKNHRPLSILVVTVLLIASCSQFIPSAVSAQGPELVPSSISLDGSIVDNYANFTYSMVYDNRDSDEAREVIWPLVLDDGIRLSNISVNVNETLYWGHLRPEEQAIAQYNESVTANETAALVLRCENGYQVRLNVRNRTIAVLSVYIEGLLTRHLGVYKLHLPILPTPISGSFHMSVILLSHYDPVATYSVDGISSFDGVSVPDGLHIEHESSTTIPGEIVLSYGLERQVGGGQLLTYTNGTDSFFVYLLAPTITGSDEPMMRQYVFVIDVSGSMSGTPIAQAKIAFNAMIESLNENDTFNIVAFSSHAEALWSEPLHATATNIGSAKNYVAQLVADGSTNFHDGCITALGSMVADSRVKTMLVLSDGQPTAGDITSTDGILAAVSEVNTLNVSISTVAFGQFAEISLMSNLAVQNKGFFTIIEPDENASVKLLDFYRRFEVPAADQYRMLFEGVREVTSLRPLSCTPFFNGTEVVVTGRYDESLHVETTIHYSMGTEIYESHAGPAGTGLTHVEYIWAQQQINCLLRQYGAGSAEDRSGIGSEIVSLAMEYGLVVEGFTAINHRVANEPQTDRTGYLTTTATTTGGSNPTTTTTAPGTQTTITETPASVWSPILVTAVIMGGVLILGLIIIVTLLQKRAG